VRLRANYLKVRLQNFLNTAGRRPTIRTGVTALTTAARAWLGTLG
jgi:hypothetical protein